MKLAIYFGMDTVPFVINWDRALLDFHHNLFFDEVYWEWVMHDADPKYFGRSATINADQHLLFGKVHENAIPVNIYGQKFPVPDFRSVFGFPKSFSYLKCECGAEKVHGSNTGHATWCPKWSKN